MKSLVTYISESQEQIDNIVKYIQAHLNDKSDDYILRINKEIKNLLVNDDNKIISFLYTEKFNKNKTDINLIQSKISQIFDLDNEDSEDIQNLNKFVTESKFDVNLINESYDIFGVLESECKRLNITNDEFINNLKVLFVDLGKIKPDKVGAYEYAFRVLFSNVHNAEKQDIKIDDTPYELKADSFAVKSAGAKSAAQCEKEFLKVLGVNFESKISKKTNNGIFSSPQKLVEFNEFLKENPVSKEKMIEALSVLVNTRCDANIDAKNKIEQVINDDGTLKIRALQQNKTGYVDNKGIKTDNLLEKLLLCCDFYNLIKAGHTKIIAFKSKECKNINDGCAVVYLDFTNIKNFDDVWKKIHIIPVTDNTDYWFKITSLWGYDPNETSQQLEQNLVCGVQLQVRK